MHCEFESKFEKPRLDLTVINEVIKISTFKQRFFLLYYIRDWNTGSYAFTINIQNLLA